MIILVFNDLADRTYTV